jgi:hypothetical protein
MKKNLLVMAALFAGAFTYAQECTAVAGLNEDFSDFTIATTGAFPQQCWSALGAGAQGPWIYTAQAGEPANQYAVYYSHMMANTAGYIVTPELSTIDGNHQLSFDVNKLAGPGGAIPPGNVTIQVGTLSDAADVTTFVAVGDPIAITDAVVNHANIVIEASTTQKFIALKFIADATFNAVALDNVVWSEVPVVCEAVATLDEGFSDFNTEGFANLPQNCWSSINPGDGPFVYATTDDEETENYIAFYSMNSANTAAYLVTPELTTIDGAHELSFDVLAGSNAGITVQPGTLSDAADAETFVAFGDLITLTGEAQTFEGLVIPASETQKYIAFKFIAPAIHNAAYVDNVKWDATAGLNDLTKNAFAIYPNPTATKNITVNFANGSEKNLVSVYSLTGAKVLETEVTGSQNLNLSALSAGMYIVKAQSGNATSSQKLVIQ